MGFRDWLVRRLGGDAPVGDPDGIVEVALVELWQSELVVAALRDAGIGAKAVHEHSAHASPQQIRPMARLFTRRRHQRQALAVVLDVQQGRLDRDVGWPPHHDEPWGPPPGDRAVP